MKDMLRSVALFGIFLLPFLPLLVTNSLFFPFITGKNFSFRIIVEIVFALWVLLAFYDARYRPRMSAVLVALVAWVAVMLAANLQGLNPFKSLWSNYERMEGFVAIFHVVLYVLALGHILNTQKLWNYFFNTSLVAASLVSIYAFAQLGGAITISQGGLRVDATLGNAAYFAVYMLFNTGIAAFMAVRTQSRGMRIFYGILACVFAGLLVQSATRGTILGLVGGIGVAAVTMIVSTVARSITTSTILNALALGALGGVVGYVTTKSIALALLAFVGVGGVTFLALAAFIHHAREKNRALIFAIGVLISMVLMVGAFISVRDSEIVKNNLVLSRIASISLEAGNVRFIIWGMAFDGFKERPILGWGQENFNYVFNKNYDPLLHGEEPWFDRVHNIVFDWLIAGGILGFVTYFSIFGVALYYVFFAPLRARMKGEEPLFSPMEQSVITGLLAGYLIHNFFVFDNIISFLFYGAFLAMIHARVSSPIVRLEAVTFYKSTLDNIVVPVVLVVLVSTVYVVNIPALLAAGDLIDGFAAPTMPQKIAAFERALSRDSFGNQEIREQLTRVTQEALGRQDVSEADKKLLKEKTEAELALQVVETPLDARIRVFVSSFYRIIGNPTRALEELKAALELSPKKQQILFEKGIAHLQLGDVSQALATFKEAHDLAPRYSNARMLYAAGALYAKDDALFKELTKDYQDIYLRNDFVLRAAYDNKRFDIVKDMLTYRSEQNPQDLQLRVSRAVAYHEGGDTAMAISILEQAVVDFPQFKEQGEKYIQDLREGKQP